MASKTVKPDISNEGPNRFGLYDGRGAAAV